MTCDQHDTQMRPDGPLDHECGQEDGHRLPHVCGQCGHRWPEPIDKTEMAWEVVKEFIDLAEAPPDLNAELQQDWQAAWIRTLAKAKVAIDPTDIYAEES